MALMVWAIDVLQECLQNDAISKEGANHKTTLMYGLYSGTRIHEAGIPSNRASPRHGEIKSYGGTNRSSRAERSNAMKLRLDDKPTSIQVITHRVMIVDLIVSNGQD